MFGLCFGSTVPAYNPHIKCVAASYPPGYFTHLSSIPAVDFLFVISDLCVVCLVARSASRVIWRD